MLSAREENSHLALEGKGQQHMYQPPFGQGLEVVTVLLSLRPSAGRAAQTCWLAETEESLVHLGPQGVYRSPLTLLHDHPEAQSV